MKLNLFTFLFFILGFISLNAQTNGDFENWYQPISEFTTLIEPNGYISSNVYAFVPDAVGDVTSAIQSSDAVSGSSSLLMEVKVVDAGTPQIVRTGVFDDEANSFGPAKEAFSDMPVDLFGSHKANLMGGDSAQIIITLTRWDITANAAVVVGGAVVSAEETVADWTNFSTPFIYNTGAMAPDSIQIAILIFNSSGAGMEHVGSSYQLDGLSFMNAVGIFTPVNQEISLTTFPNPTTDVLNFDFGTESLENMSIINIVTADGKLVRTHQVLDSREAVQVSDLTEGIYYYQVLNDKGYTVAGASFHVLK